MGMSKTTFAEQNGGTVNPPAVQNLLPMII